MTIPRITAEHMVCPICTLDWERCVCIQPDCWYMEEEARDAQASARMLGGVLIVAIVDVLLIGAGVWWLGWYLGWWR